MVWSNWQILMPKQEKERQSYTTVKRRIRTLTLMTPLERSLSKLSENHKNIVEMNTQNLAERVPEPLIKRVGGGVGVIDSTCITQSCNNACGFVLYLVPPPLGWSWCLSSCCCPHQPCCCDFHTLMFPVET